MLKVEEGQLGREGEGERHSNAKYLRPMENCQNHTQATGVVAITYNYYMLIKHYKQTNRLIVSYFREALNVKQAMLIGLLR